MVMMRRAFITAVALSLAIPACSAMAADDDGNINIMVPEKGAPAEKKPRKGRRGSSNPVYPIPLPRPQSPQAVPKIHNVKPRTVTPPPLYVPQTGQLVPNQPAIGSGVGGRETFQDRATRCVNQSGISPGVGSNRGAYVGGCVNQ
jgi:hypothetical protein